MLQFRRRTSLRKFTRVLTRHWYLFRDTPLGFYQFPYILFLCYVSSGLISGLYWRGFVYCFNVSVPSTVGGIVETSDLDDLLLFGLFCKERLLERKGSTFIPSFENKTWIKTGCFLTNRWRFYCLWDPPALY